MHNERDLRSLYVYFLGLPYIAIVLEWLFYIFIYSDSLSGINSILLRFKTVSLFQEENILFSKLFIILLIVIASVGSRPKKSLKLQLFKHIVIPLLLGIIIFFGSTFFFLFDADFENGISTFEILYMVFSIIGAVLFHMGADNISKSINHKLGQDPFNYDNESFRQPEKRDSGNYSMNLRIEYYFKGRMRKGWLNFTNPFRGTMVIGVPESGKTFSFIIPFIKTYIRKGFTMLIYDYKYPDLSQVAEYQYRKMFKEAGYNHSFHTVNLQDIEHSVRVNPLSPTYLKGMAGCIETSEAIVDSIIKSGNDAGNTKFFRQSAVNFLSACIYFLYKHEKGKYCTFPHLLSLINRSYDDLFGLFQHDIELDNIIAPFKSAHEHKAYDQLEGQMGTLRITLSVLATPETYWVFSGNDIPLDISSKRNPTILIIASSPATENISATINSMLLNRVSKLINTKGNLPCGIVVDELPTLYFHKIQNLISTARSNKVAVVFGLQELPQLVESYGRNVSNTVVSVVGNIISGAVRKKETLDWLEKLFGKIKQISHGANVSDRTSTNLSETRDFLMPGSKIANLKTGEIVAKLASGNLSQYSKKSDKNTYNCKVILNLKEIDSEADKYTIPTKYYSFPNEERKRELLLKNMQKINQEVDLIIDQVRDKKTPDPLNNFVSSDHKPKNLRPTTRANKEAS